MPGPGTRSLLPALLKQTDGRGWLSLARPANAIDFWRGFALVTIFVNHIPGIAYERFTHRNISPSDSAELFVFLAGWALRLSIERPGTRIPAVELARGLTQRAFTIYMAQVVLTTLALALLATSARVLANPLLLEWHNAAAVFYDPINAHIGLALLTHQLGYFDILPLYVILMLAAPAIALVHRGAPGLLLPLSLAVYFVTLVLRIDVPTWPVPGTWLFNPLAWQLVFVLGFSLAGQDGAGGWARRHIVWLRWAGLPVVIFAAMVVLFDWWPDPTRLPEPRLLFLAQKTFVTPIRLIQFLALAAVCSAAYPTIARLVPVAAEYLAMLGRNSLNVFCVGSLASLTAQVVRFTMRGGFLIDTSIVLAGIVILGVTAWVSEWADKSKARR